MGVTSLSLLLFSESRILLKGTSLSEESGCGLDTVSAFRFCLIGMGCVVSGTVVLLFCDLIRDCDGPPEGMHFDGTRFFTGNSLSLSL